MRVVCDVYSSSYDDLTCERRELTSLLCQVYGSVIAALSVAKEFLKPIKELFCRNMSVYSWLLFPHLLASDGGVVWGGSRRPGSQDPFDLTTLLRPIL